MTQDVLPAVAVDLLGQDGVLLSRIHVDEVGNFNISESHWANAVQMLVLDASGVVIGNASLPHAREADDVIDRLRGKRQ